MGIEAEVINHGILQCSVCKMKNSVFYFKTIFELKPCYTYEKIAIRNEK